MRSVERSEASRLQPRAVALEDVVQPVPSQCLDRPGSGPPVLVLPPMPPPTKLFRPASQKNQDRPRGRRRFASFPFPGVVHSPRRPPHEGSASCRPCPDCRAISPPRRAVSPFARSQPGCGPRRESSRSRDPLAQRPSIFRPHLGACRDGLQLKPVSAAAFVLERNPLALGNDRLSMARSGEQPLAATPLSFPEVDSTQSALS